MIRVLVAEDDPVNAKLIELMLENPNYSVHVVGNGAEVLAAVERTVYDVVLMDVRMPEMDGFAASRRIREKYGVDGPYIIALTALAVKGYEELARQAGMNEYLTKPMRRSDIVDAIERAVTKRARDERIAI